MSAAQLVALAGGEASAYARNRTARHGREGTIDMAGKKPTRAVGGGKGNAPSSAREMQPHEAVAEALRVVSDAAQAWPADSTLIGAAWVLDALAGILQSRAAGCAEPGDAEKLLALETAARGSSWDGRGWRYPARSEGRGTNVRSDRNIRIQVTLVYLGEKLAARMAKELARTSEQRFEQASWAADNMIDMMVHAGIVDLAGRDIERDMCALTSALMLRIERNGRPLTGEDLAVETLVACGVARAVAHDWTRMSIRMAKH